MQRGSKKGLIAAAPFVRASKEASRRRCSFILILLSFAHSFSYPLTMNHNDSYDAEYEEPAEDVSSVVCAKETKKQSFEFLVLSDAIRAPLSSTSSFRFRLLCTLSSFALSRALAISSESVSHRRCE